MKSVIIIPARYSSSRYPGKPLVKILGKPLIIWTAETCAKAIRKQCVCNTKYDLNSYYR